jgi:hypothetical protein
MRTFMTCQPRALPFRLLLVVAGVLMLMAALAPSANAQSLIAYYNFEDPVEGGAPDYTAEPIAFVQASMVPGGPNPYAFPAVRETDPGLTLNVWPTDPDTPILGLGLSRSSLHNGATFDIPLFSSQGFFQNMTFSFAVNSNGNGFNTVNTRFSTDGGATFTLIATHTIRTGPGQVFSDAVPVAANNKPLLVLELQFMGGQSNGIDVQNVLDNVTVSGTIVPEPTTIAGGLLGVLGLCWFQRRRLIRSVRLRHA